MKNPLSLREVNELLRESKVEISPEDNRNPIVIAAALNIVNLVEVDRVETGFFNGVDQSRMITDGKIVQSIAFGQCVMQAIRIGDES
jgi:hypothetical protein